MIKLPGTSPSDFLSVLFGGSYPSKNERLFAARLSGDSAKLFDQDFHTPHR